MKALTIIVGFLLVGANSLIAQDQDLTVTGDLTVELDSNEEKGNLVVEGGANLTLHPMPYQETQLQQLGLSESFFYGPVTLGDGIHFARHKVVKDLSTGDPNTLVDIPLPVILGAGRTEITATIYHAGNRNSATWILDGGRHNEVRCIQHTAFGSGRYISLNGRMNHKIMFLSFDVDTTESDFRYGFTEVEFLIRAVCAGGSSGGFWMGAHNHSGTKSKIEPVLSQVISTKKGSHEHNGVIDRTYGSWKGDRFVFDGELVIAEPLGGLSMGVYTNNPPLAP
ncbi:MAG: hypothetical protein AAF591_04110 [Verrucomicrobiota bacterium]